MTIITFDLRFALRISGVGRLMEAMVMFGILEEDLILLQFQDEAANSKLKGIFSATRFSLANTKLKNARILGNGYFPKSTIGVGTDNSMLTKPEMASVSCVSKKNITGRRNSGLRTRNQQSREDISSNLENNNAACIAREARFNEFTLSLDCSARAIRHPVLRGLHFILPRE